MATKKDYEKVAAAINKTKQFYCDGQEDVRSEAINEAIDKLKDNLAEEFKVDNSRFNKERFLKAC